MSATDELRRLLDERGVEWTEPNNKARSHTTYWTAGVLRCGAVEFIDGMVSIAATSDDITPEQAIEATLGSDLQAENEKLRELVRKVEHYEQLGCHDCPHDGSCAVDTLYDEGCAMSREIEFEKRKLGIEVDA